MATASDQLTIGAKRMQRSQHAEDRRDDDKYRAQVISVRGMNPMVQPQIQ